MLICAILWLRAKKADDLQVLVEAVKVSELETAQRMAHQNVHSIWMHWWVQDKPFAGSWVEGVTAGNSNNAIHFLVSVW